MHGAYTNKHISVFETINNYQLRGFVRRSFLSDDKQSHVWDNNEDQKDDFEQPEERVHEYVVGFSWNGNPFALRTVYKIRSEFTYYNPVNEQDPVYDCTPHEECC